MFGKNLRYVLAVAALAALTLSLPQVGDAMYGLFSSNPPTTLVAAANSTQAVTVSEIKAKMEYTKDHKETMLNVTAKVKLFAATSDLSISNDAFFFLLKNKTLNRDGGYSGSSLVTASKLKKNADGTYTLKKGATETFTAVLNYNPQALIAGQYYAVLQAVATPQGKMPVSSNKSNNVTVIGESTPYITFASKSDLFGLKDTVAVNGVRLGKEVRVTIADLGFINQNGDGYSKTFTLKLKEKTTQFKFNLGDYGIPAGDYYMYVENTSSGATPGKSNNLHIQVLNQDKLVVAKVTPGKFALSYDANKEESALGAPFEVSIKAGTNDLVFAKESFSVAAYRNSSGDSSYVIAAVEKVDGKTTAFPFTLKAGKTAVFSVKASFNPKIMLAGSYSSSLWWVAATRADGPKELIQIPKNETNSVVIVGETSPYITSVTNPAEAGKNFTIYGQRLFGVSIVIDGTPLAGVSRVQAPDGTSLGFVLPSTLTPGFHSISVMSDATGASNTFYFDVAGVVTPQSITVTSPNGGEAFVVGNSSEDVTPIPVSWNSSGFENLPETSLWVGLINESGVRCNIGTISSYAKSFNIGMFLDYSGCIAKGGGPTLSAGKYQVVVSNNSGESTLCPEGYICSEPFDTVKDISDSYFTISSNNPASLSDVHVTSLATGNRVTQLEKGKNAVIRWTQKNISNSVIVALYRFDNGVWSKATNIITTVPTTGASEFQSFNWNVPSSLDISAQYRIQVDTVGANGSYEVSFIDPVQRYPVLSGLTGPKTLRVGETGQWNLLAVDPDGGPISVSVDWQSLKGVADTSKAASRLYTHTYTQAGTNTIVFYATNSTGLTTSTSTTVIVTP